MWISNQTFDKASCESDPQPQAANRRLSVGDLLPGRGAKSYQNSQIVFYFFRFTYLDLKDVLFCITTWFYLLYV